MKIVYDCQTCGACCHWPEKAMGRWIIQVHKDDKQVPERYTLPNDSDEPGELGEYPRIMNQIEGVKCVAHEGAVGKANRCTIYENRPRTCRNFEAGSPWCRKARVAAGLPINSPEYVDEPE